MKPFVLSGHLDHIRHGETLLSQGKVAVLVLAGGDGSRLGWSGPKGTFPIYPGKTLFDLLSDRIEEARKRYRVCIPCALMVSSFNRQATSEALGEKGKELFSLYTQKSAPLLGEDHLPCGGESPNGNGEALQELLLSGTYDAWKEQGVEYVHVVPIDNPLADPCDPNLCGFHALKNAQVTLKAAPRKEGPEQAGVLSEIEGKICVVEYTKAPPSNATAIHTGLFCFSMGFIEKALEWKLPLHLAKKKKGDVWVYKQEYFLFDVLHYASAVEVLLYPREEIFAPLKTREDVIIVRKMLSESR